MTEPDYRSFENRSPGGSYLDEREARLRKEWKEWKKNRKRNWYL
jgi:hypothetical protein